MAECVVDILETVEVDKQQRDTGAATTGADQCIFQPVIEQKPVGQFGQGVVVRQAFDVLFNELAFGDIGKYGNILVHCAVIITHDTDTLPRRVYLAVFPAIPDFTLPVSGFNDRSPYLTVERLIVMM